LTLFTNNALLWRAARKRRRESTRATTSSRVKRVQDSKVNEARRRRVLTTMIVGTFGVGFAAGVLTTKLTKVPAADAVRVAQRGDAPAPAAGLNPGPWLAGAVDPAPSAVQWSATEALQARPQAGHWAAPTSLPEAPRALKRPTATVAQLTATEAPQALPRPHPGAARRAATEAAPALPAANQMVALALPEHEVDGLSSAAAASEEALLDKASLPGPRGSTERVVVRRGDTLMDILSRARIDQAEAYAAVQSLRQVYDPRRLRAGQALAITADDDTGDDAADDARRRLLGLRFDLSFDHQIRVTRSADGSYDATKTDRPQHRELTRTAGTIDDSLYLAAERAELPQEVTAALIKLFSWDVDFQRDLRPGDAFETLYDEVSLEDGSGAVHGGDLLYGALTLSGTLLGAYRFELEDGDVEYFDRNGKSLRKFLLRTPVDGARISSRFGMRMHPILGYSLMHKGVDFAAPVGTPIYAAGNGRVVVAGRNGGYGNYVRIRHNGDYSTAYAHMLRFARGIAPGHRVTQGQVIGYIGTTGRSTGPHLHYEVLRDDAQINPMSVKQAPNTQLAGADLKRFQQEVARIDLLRTRLAHDTMVASRLEERPAAN
jgi:murein DD-endopeptidase MepM/ murein hydrolase activator NlpD